MDTIQLTDAQRARFKQMIAEINGVRARIAPLQDLDKSLQMSVQIVLQTILEMHEVAPTAIYEMNNDGTALTLKKE